MLPSKQTRIKRLRLRPRNFGSDIKVRRHRTRR